VFIGALGEGLSCLGLEPPLDWNSMQKGGEMEE
jgi:hypothetical protein